ncbi:hypothetical protein AVEN_203003-1 [Araneus ventricosus]|uniref:Uncharacterized protein n=1 Tax=Araneus ventricosus TaxID=182803 RepID=A0A4Y2EQY8_ARAVE|nr:hypothetical protein AVEN_203003-1 [Araneus ventricosus]
MFKQYQVYYTKGEKGKSKKAKKDASQDDNNEQLGHTCDADVLFKECVQKTTTKLRSVIGFVTSCVKCGYMKTTIFDTFCVDCDRKNRSVNK